MNVQCVACSYCKFRYSIIYRRYYLLSMAFDELKKKYFFLRNPKFVCAKITLPHHLVIIYSFEEHLLNGIASYC